jgi:hypothetical protein
MSSSFLNLWFSDEHNDTVFWTELQHAFLNYLLLSELLIDTFVSMCFPTYLKSLVYMYITSREVYYIEG